MRSSENTIRIFRGRPSAGSTESCTFHGNRRVRPSASRNVEILASVPAVRSGGTVLPEVCGWIFPALHEPSYRPAHTQPLADTPLDERQALILVPSRVPARLSVG